MHSKTAGIMNSYNNYLTINKIRLIVKLGYEKEERTTPQPIEIDIKLYFPDLSDVNRKDDGDFICYDKMSHLIKDLCDSKEFRLIEYLGTEIYNVIRPTVANEIKIKVKITKCILPVSFIMGGASFSYTDLPPGSWVIPE